MCTEANHGAVNQPRTRPQKKIAYAPDWRPSGYPTERKDNGASCGPQDRRCKAGMGADPLSADASPGAHIHHEFMRTAEPLFGTGRNETERKEHTRPDCPDQVMAEKCRLVTL